MTKKIELSKRKFHKTVLKVTVLSEYPYSYNDLGDVAHDTEQGDCSGKVEQVSAVELDGRQAARELRKQASDAGFFRLTDKGEDADD